MVADRGSSPDPTLAQDFSCSQKLYDSSPLKCCPLVHAIHCCQDRRPKAQLWRFHSLPPNWQWPPTAFEAGQRLSLSFKASHRELTSALHCSLPLPGLSLTLAARPSDVRISDPRGPHLQAAQMLLLSWAPCDSCRLQ